MKLRPPGAPGAHAHARTSPPPTRRPASSSTSRPAPTRRRHAHRRSAGAIVLDRGSNDDFGFEALAALLAVGPLPLAGARRSRPTACSPTASASAPTARRRAPPAAFAIETLIDELAAELDLDPIELRLRNVLREGDRGLDGQPFPVFGAAECLERVREHPLWERRGELPDGEGVGVAIGWWPGGLEPAAASCRLDSDGRLTDRHRRGRHERHRDRVPVDRRRGLRPRPRVGARRGRRHRRRALRRRSAAAARSSTRSGAPSQRAAEQARERLLEVAATELEIAPEDLEIVDGAVRPVGAPDRGVTVAELAAKVLQLRQPATRRSRATAAPRRPAARPARAAHLSHVRVDRETGAVTLLHHVIAQDVGRALNPALVEGQLVGGVTQGLGWALFEQLAYDETGQLRTGSFVEYAVPTHRPRAADRRRDRRGPGARRALRRQGRRRAAGRRRARRGGQRDRRGDGRCACASCR